MERSSTAKWSWADSSADACTVSPNVWELFHTVARRCQKTWGAKLTAANKAATSTIPARRPRDLPRRTRSNVNKVDHTTFSSPPRDAVRTSIHSMERDDPANTQVLKAERSVMNKAAM